MFEVVLAALVVAAVYLVEGDRMQAVAGWLGDFIDYLERQQQRG